MDYLKVYFISTYRYFNLLKLPVKWLSCTQGSIPLLLCWYTWALLVRNEVECRRRVSAESDGPGRPGTICITDTLQLALKPPYNQWQELAAEETSGKGPPRVYNSEAM